MTMIVRAQQHDTLDLLCWRHCGATAGVVEAALELNRNQLNEPTLRHGQLVTLPDRPTKAVPIADVVNLWD